MPCGFYILHWIRDWLLWAWHDLSWVDRGTYQEPPISISLQLQILSSLLHSRNIAVAIVSSYWYPIPVQKWIFNQSMPEALHAPPNTAEGVLYGWPVSESCSSKIIFYSQFPRTILDIILGWFPGNRLRKKIVF